MTLTKGQNIIYNFIFFFLTMLILCVVFPSSIFTQEISNCQEIKNNRADKIYEKGIRAYKQRNLSECIRSMNDVIDIEPDYADAYYVLGMIYMEKSRMNLKAAAENLSKVIEICPDYDTYAYYHLARISYGNQEYQNAFNYINYFLEDIDKIRNDEDYNEAISIQDYSRFYIDILNNPVPFRPEPVEGISTEMDEYLPIISPDNEMALFTRKIKIPPRRDDITPRTIYKEKFMYSLAQNGGFSRGHLMPLPFNKNDNEGGATLTIDNKFLFYTLCKYTKDSRYYNCDICFSKNTGTHWTEIQSIGNKVNMSDSWESQPTITSDGNTLYFVSDRDGGLGGYDIYLTRKDNQGNWGNPENIGAPINTPGNEKSPFIHTDSQTLYFSSDGLMGIGGYDIFYTRMDSTGKWEEPVNIGYPINSYGHDIGFFVSTDGHHGYFASDKYEGNGGWDLYSFNLYEEARPEKVLFVKGKINDNDTAGYKKTKIELKSVSSKRITEIPVDTLTGEYVAAVLFRSDYVMTVKKQGFVQESKYISKMDPKFTAPINIEMELKPIEVGKSYRLNDIYFDFNSVELKPESIIVIEEFRSFLEDNPGMKISIEGHTDNIGNIEDNLLLSQERAKAVYEELIVQGISSDRLNYKGFGESKAVATNDTELGRAKNRRTEFVIMDK